MSSISKMPKEKPLNSGLLNRKKFYMINILPLGQGGPILALSSASKLFLTLEKIMQPKIDFMGKFESF